MRVFIALDLPPPWRAAASDAQRALRAMTGPGLLRFVDPALMHLTLRFLGEIDAPSAARLDEALSRLVTDVDVTLELDRAGTFGPPQRTAVAWIGIAGARDRLNEIVTRVESAVGSASLPRERRPFRPHLTLMRVHRSASTDERRAIAATVAALDPPPPSTTAFREIVVVRSHLGGAQPRYEVLARHGGRGLG